MLVRAARRKISLPSSRSRISCDLSLLPRTRSIFASAPESRRWSSLDGVSQSNGLRKRRNSQDAAKLPSRRSLATVVGYSGDDMDIPFEGMGNMPPSYGSQTPSILGTPASFDPIYLGGSLATPPARHRVTKSLGMGGTLDDLKSVFEACLHIGRIERAEVIIRRILDIPQLPAEEILNFHNQYLRASVEQILLRPSEAATQRLHSWFELQIRMKQIHYDFETLAYMVKASLQAQPGQRERLVRRYMDMLDEQSAVLLLSTEVLTAREVNDIAHIYPKYEWAAEATVEDSDIIEDGLNEVYEADESGPTTTPHVKAMEQKGLGLKTLKSSLSIFSKLSDEMFDISKATPEEKREIQARIEQDAVDSAIDRWKEENEHLQKMGIDSHLQTKSLGSRMWKWHVELEKYLKKELVRVEQSELAEDKLVQDRARCHIGPLLRVLPTDKLAATVILSVMRVFGSQGVSKGVALSSATTTVAGTVEDEYTLRTLQRDIKNKIWPTRPSGESVLTPEVLLKATKARGPGSAAKLVRYFAAQNQRKEAHPTAWTVEMKAKLGAFLVSALIEVAKIPVTLTHNVTKECVTQIQPAFSHSHQYKMGKRLGIVVANKVLVDQLKRDPVHSVLAKHLPMLVTPDPWTNFEKGGFLCHPGRVMRVKNGDQDQKFYAEAAVNQGSMKQIFKGLDILGKTSWRINQGVFNVMLEAWNSGEALASIPPENPKLDVPEEPETSQDPLERRRWIRAVKSMENQRTGLHSQRCFQNFQLEIARALRNETFYFPHNIDFRGRAYPIPPYLNHMGADHCRGLLLFGEGKALGTGGLKWLKIHLANVFGYDKASLSEREEFSMKNLGDVIDSASNPLNGRKWWLDAEDPWQCLAACMELKSALESDEPEKFLSRLPIHQDGTCNGLQHYAALGGDSWGAKQVNLEPGDRPADVYTAVANLVIESIDRDREAGDTRAVMLEGKVTRKTVKQTVMTNVYGVTYIGAKAQVKKQLVAANPNLTENETHNPSVLASYIATKIFTALSSMFRGAHDIQYWLGECAQRILSSLTTEQLDLLEVNWSELPPSGPRIGRQVRNGLDDVLQFKSGVIWTSPMHMPVVQPYRKSSSKLIRTNMQSITLMDPHRSDPVDKRKQLQGFPPNFIHSLDATHMLLSALKCDELGLSFAAVHDSFWTHASDVSTMNGVLRDAFIQIHSEDVIGRLRAEFEARYKGAMYSAKLKVGSDAAKKIKAWRDAYGRKSSKTPVFKSIPRADELVLERRRIKLLASSNPEEVAKGKAMVTPGSIFAETASDADVDIPEEFQSTQLGSMSRRAMKSASVEPDSMDDGEDQLDPELAIAGDKSVEDGELNDGESEVIDDSEEAEGYFERTLRNTKKQGSEKTTEVWLPIAFPPLPKKGDFDVSRLKDSKYFFS